MGALSTAVPKGKPEASPLGTAAESEPRGRPERAVQCGCMTQGSDQFSPPEERSVHPSYDPPIPYPNRLRVELPFQAQAQTPSLLSHRRPPARRLPDGSPTAARRLPDGIPTPARRLPDGKHDGKPARRQPDYCPTAPRQPG